MHQGGRRVEWRSDNPATNFEASSTITKALQICWLVDVRRAAAAAAATLSGGSAQGEGGAGREKMNKRAWTANH